MKLSLKQFQQQYPNDAACLERLFKPVPCSCGRNKWYRIRTRPVYMCACGRQISPLAGTIFEKTRTPLTTWFYVIYLFLNAKSGLSAAFVQRIIGGSYNRAFRMLHKIRSLMKDTTKLEGHVELDETILTPKPWRNSRIPKQWRWDNGRVLIGMVSLTGQVRVQHIDVATAWRVRNFLKDNLKPGAHVHTDGGKHYHVISKVGYGHSEYMHWQKFAAAEKSFKPTKGQSTQRIEGFWSQFKRGIIGVYRSVSTKYLQAYADEFAWRYSHRNQVALISIFLDRVTQI